MLSNKCISDIKRLPIEERQEVYMDELFERRCEIKEQELKKLTKSKLKDILYDEFTDEDGLMEKYIKDCIDTSTKKELIAQIVDGYDGSEQEHIDWIVNVYIDD